VPTPGGSEGETSVRDELNAMAEEWGNIWDEVSVTSLSHHLA
jgi:hypothetical protein